MLTDVHGAFAGGGMLSSVLFALEAGSLIDLFTFIARSDPGLSFNVRGVGELGAGDL